MLLRIELGLHVVQRLREVPLDSADEEPRQGQPQQQRLLRGPRALAKGEPEAPTAAPVDGPALVAARGAWRRNQRAQRREPPEACGRPARAAELVEELAAQPTGILGCLIGEADLQQLPQLHGRGLPEALDGGPKQLRPRHLQHEVRLRLVVHLHAHGLEHRVLAQQVRLRAVAWLWLPPPQRRLRRACAQRHSLRQGLGVARRPDDLKAAPRGPQLGQRHLHDARPQHHDGALVDEVFLLLQGQRPQGRRVQRSREAHEAAAALAHVTDELLPLVLQHDRLDSQFHQSGLALLQQLRRVARKQPLPAARHFSQRGRLLHREREVRYAGQRRQLQLRPQGPAEHGDDDRLPGGGRLDDGLQTREVRRVGQL
mmetsp:Transcript_87730/g.231150  ORF Transcript_87730/g.231150 Transcript_87730/m.231150 type:complete len:371 (-) Transcript_87730:301-1413(-)